MIRMTLADVAAAAGGTVRDGDPGAVVSAVSHDVTTLGAGALYVCVDAADAGGRPGERDPRAARAAGAVAVLSDRPLGVPAIVVNEVLPAYRRLALALTVGLPEVSRVAVTGGAGRAAAARLTGHVLARLGPVVPSGGRTQPADVYETLLRADEETRFLVAELNAGRRGETAALLPAVRPGAGVVLGGNVSGNGGGSVSGSGRGGGVSGSGNGGGSVSRSGNGGGNVTGSGSGGIGGGSGNDGGIGGGRPGAGELVAGLSAGGLAVLDADDWATVALAGRTGARVVTFGRHRSARVRAERVVLDGRARARFVLHTPVGSAQVELRLHGEHLVPAALAAAAVALEHTHDVWLIADALGSAVPDEGTGVRERADGVTVLDDPGDATPESVLAALRTAVSVAAGRRRTIAVLSSVESRAPAGSESIGQAAARLGIDEIIAVGGADAAGYGGTHVPDRAAAAAVLAELVRPGDVVLVAGDAVAGLAGEPAS